MNETITKAEPALEALEAEFGPLLDMAEAAEIMDDYAAYLAAQEDAQAEREYEAWVEQRSQEHEQYLASLDY